jgi:hypothetical protein
MDHEYAVDNKATFGILVTINEQPIRFIDLLAELQEKTIKRAFQAEWKIEGHDFGVTALCLSCRTMGQFSVLFVNRKLYAEAVPHCLCQLRYCSLPAYIVLVSS